MPRPRWLQSPRSETCSAQVDDIAVRAHRHTLLQATSKKALLLFVLARQVNAEMARGIQLLDDQKASRDSTLRQTCGREAARCERCLKDALACCRVKICRI